MEQSEGPSAEPQPAMSIADMLRDAASEVLDAQAPPGFHYVEEYSMYYSNESGYYYDVNTSLFYHPSTMTYYYYDAEEQSYKVYKTLVKLKWRRKLHKKRASKVFGEAFLQTMLQDDVDVCEMLFSIVDDVAVLTDIMPNSDQGEVFIDGEFVQFADPTRLLDDDEDDDELSMDEDERIEMMKEEGFLESACVRLMNTSSNHLDIVTVMGATIGSSDKADIRIEGQYQPTIAARIRYEEPERAYYLVLSENAVCDVNGELMKSATEKVLNHDDVINFGDEDKLLVHIHSGRNTCSSCEPGLLQGKKERTNGYVPTITGRKAMRKQLKKLKMAYGLLGEEDLPDNGTYEDRSAKRRREVGSTPIGGKRDPTVDPMYSNCQARPVPGAVPIQTTTAQRANVNTKIEEGNKGFKLLKMMGWKEGEGLGKEGGGRVEPVQTTVKLNKAGLGHQAPAPAPNVRQTTKQLHMQKTIERFEKIKQSEQQQEKKEGGGS